MARKPRIEFAGAIYHVLNRGNYKTDLFDSAGAAQAFIECLFQTCERMGWKLHAFCLMRNHYHLAVETPQGNLVTGVHWLQSTFGNRFNRFRGEHGRAVQGRYQAILVEPGHHLANLVNYIHLNPVRAKVVTLEQLGQFRWSSYRHFTRGAGERPAFLLCEDWLGLTGGFADTPQGWSDYHGHLTWLMADEDRQKQAAFDRMSRGWVHGSEAFQKNVLARFKRMPGAKDWGGPEVTSIKQVEWKRLLDQALRALNRDLAMAHSEPKSAPWKIAVATWLKQRSSVSNRWLTEQLGMGAPDAVSRYVSECQKSQRPEAQLLIDRLTTRVRG
jgi:REP element-mobilizing transposase RayT